MLGGKIERIWRRWFVHGGKMVTAREKAGNSRNLSLFLPVRSFLSSISLYVYLQSFSLFPPLLSSMSPRFSLPTRQTLRGILPQKHFNETGPR